MESLPPIPTPLAQRWREFRIQVLPLIVFLVTLAAIVYLWRNYVFPVGVVGEVEAVRVNIVATAEGTLIDMPLSRFDTVEQGQPLGQVQTMDASTHEVSLKVIAADLKVTQARMDLDKQRNFDTYNRMRVEWLKERVALGMAEVNLRQAEREYIRVTNLFAQKIVSEDQPDIALRDRDNYQQELNILKEVVAEHEKALKEMERMGMNKVTAIDPLVEEAIKAQQLQLDLLEKPSTLKAPIAGVVAAVYKRAGEKVVRGDVIATIASTSTERIVGYLRQPIAAMPSTNDTVTVRTRSQPRQTAEAPILRVGVQFEMINPMLISVDSNRVEMGLPILIAMPPGLKVLPGEALDLSIQKRSKSS